ncbi:MAG: tyrosine-type recombinase/integrase [bacterium]|nr:tyrosine-type recombinase/integrase [bacterium]
MAQIIKRGVNTWQVRIYTGRDRKTNKRQFHTKTIHGTKKDACLYASEYESNHVKGYTAQKSITIDSAWKRYITACAIKLNPNTIHARQNIFNKHISTFSKLPLVELTTLDIQSLINLLSNDIKPNTVKTIYGVFRAFLNQCVAWDLIIKNPCVGVIIPKVTRHLDSIKPLNSEEIARFMVACKSHKYGLFMRLQLLTGCRTSELRALCWDCVNFADSTILIKRGVNTKTKKIQDCTKNDTSKRIIKLDEITLLSLKKVKLASKTELVFPGAIPEHVITIDTLLKALKQILKIAGIERDHFRLYDLRHSCATYLLNAGVPVKAVSERLGHASSKMTLDIYTHYTSDLNGPLYNALSKIDEETERLISNQ